MSKAKFSAESFTNEFGTVKPGDKICFVTHSTGFVRMCTGVYLGFTETGGELRCRVQSERESREMVHKDTGKKFDWSREYNSRTWDTVKDTLENRMVTRTVTTSLQLNRIVGLK
jgi:hypothetical protein